MTVWLWRAAVLLASLAIWEAAARMLNPILYVEPSRLPAAPGRVSATRDLPPLAGHVWLTLGEIAAAYALAVAGGLWVGFVLGLRKTLGRIYEPLLAALYAVPSVVWYPSLMLFFGFGPASKIASKAIGWPEPATKRAYELPRPLLSTDGRMDLGVMKFMQDTLLELGFLRTRMPLTEMYTPEFTPVKL